MARNYTGARAREARAAEENAWEDAFVAPLSAGVPAALGGLRLDQALARIFPQYSRNRLQAWLKTGHVKVKRGAFELAVEGSTRVEGDETVVLSPPPAADAAAPAAQAMALDLVFEDADLIVIDKPAGLVVHPGAGNPDRTLLNALLAHSPELRRVPRAGIVHRLDKDTTGLLVVAKNVTAQARLAEQLASRSVRRLYLALVQGDPPARGSIDAPVARDRNVRTRMAVARGGKEARTHFRVLERFGSAALIECRLETGRTHQIRVHMQHIRHPLVGDTVYRRGTRHAVSFPRQALHAAELHLVHPRTGKPMRWKADLPADMAGLIARLRRDS
ncbi:MAG TPA: RluA family pseudouridine synthase [Burkholderiales bacterium]|jgi:23S rRNA pseudouridine1911/1915/1917 synthase|nr:RluA family pseudouridine synthase [Burkholderiales bacterium]